MQQKCTVSGLEPHALSEVLVRWLFLDFSLYIFLMYLDMYCGSHLLQLNLKGNFHNS